MASYHYDESGNMALYFIITFLVILLIPFTISALTSVTSSRPSSAAVCECGPCVDQRKRINQREKRGLLNPKLSKKSWFVILGWVAVVGLGWKVSNAVIENTIYNPYEILGLAMGVTEKEIKSHYKKLSKVYHPDKMKPTENQTIEDIASHFVDLTKAYKSLTDETIRKNFEEYGHPDGRQEVTMGIALPRWIVEAQNNIWVLGVYGLLFGVSLPMLVGRWWFGSRQKTKDGINAQTASVFFKSLTETATIDEVFTTLSKAVEFSSTASTSKTPKVSAEAELKELEKQIAEKEKEQWADLKELIEEKGEDMTGRKKVLVLLHAHLLRLEIKDAGLKKEQADLLLQTPYLLNALLNIAMARNWLQPTVAVMRLHAYLTQALLPLPPSPMHDAERKLQKYAQLPGIKEEDVRGLGVSGENIGEVIGVLQSRNDERIADIKKAIGRWGKVEIVDAQFQVLGERIVTPSALVNLLVKLRLSPPTDATEPNGLTSTDTTPPTPPSEVDVAKDLEFLTSPKDFEELATPTDGSGVAHAPYWPTKRRPGWWIVLADDKSNRIVVPPMRIFDIPYSDPSKARNYRSYKLKFQAPPGVGLFTWRVYVVSDTFIGEDVVRDISLKIDDVSALNDDEKGEEDYISDPEEDSLAGQMAAMRGGPVKKIRPQESDDEDDESGTDDDEKNNDSDSSSDSD